MATDLSAKDGLSQTPVQALRGVGQAVADKLARCHIHSVQDLLFHLPIRYEDRTRITPMQDVRTGDRVLVEGVVTSNQIKFGRRRALMCRIADKTGHLYLRFFYFNSNQRHQLQIGKRIRCFGEARVYSSHLEIVHPEYQVIEPHKVVPIDGSLTPVYPTTEGLNQKSFRALIQKALILMQQDHAMDDYLPENLLDALQFQELKTALHTVHRPPPDAPLPALMEGKHPAIARLCFEELLAHHLSLKRFRQRLQKAGAPKMLNESQLTEKMVKALPYSLTGAQQRTLKEISDDLMKDQPMLRLVQGDVGSGKTVVAALAALTVIENQFQVAFMAPTELLAEQHFENFQQWLSPLNISVERLSSSMKIAEKREILERLQNGETQVVIGTHALFQKQVVYHNLGLIIIDEQHRFGVDQRLALREKGKDGMSPHQLIMTATPIPRTLAMTFYADLDNSIIDEMPPGRQPIETIAFSQDRRDEVIDRIKQICKAGRQVYWVCTLIDESEVLQCQAAEDVAKLLQQLLTPLNVGLVHGRLKPNERESMMQDFKAGKVHVLVATTVIEVGVDVPNATLMVIENAERLGLSQLHQLRGRVGRGKHQSYCVLLYQTPLSQNAKKRIQIMRETQDGFVVAQKDLEIRGHGELLGKRQTGAVTFRIADLERDQYLLKHIQKAQAEITKHPKKMDALIQRWIPNSEAYSQTG